jgi:RND family efflux transporter MFP subunit
MQLAGDAKSAAERGTNVPVKLKLIGEATFSHDGKTDFVDNHIDRASGTIRGRAEFPNPNGIFTPGMFGRVQMAISAPAEALLVPDVAIGTEQVRKFVLVVDGENVARPKYVTLGDVVDGLRVVKDGIEANDRVVVNGLMRARPGTKVTPLDAADNSAPAAASPATTKTN